MCMLHSGVVTTENYQVIRGFYGTPVVSSLVSAANSMQVHALSKGFKQGHSCIQVVSSLSVFTHSGFNSSSQARAYLSNFM